MVLILLSRANALLLRTSIMLVTFIGCQGSYYTFSIIERTAIVLTVVLLAIAYRDGCSVHRDNVKSGFADITLHGSRYHSPTTALAGGKISPDWENTFAVRICSNSGMQSCVHMREYLFEEAF